MRHDAGKPNLSVATPIVSTPKKTSYLAYISLDITWHKVKKPTSLFAKPMTLKYNTTNEDEPVNVGKLTPRVATQLFVTLNTNSA
jgi:hypothetical protein